MRGIFFDFSEVVPVSLVWLGGVLVAGAGDPEVVTLPVDAIGEIPEMDSTPPQSTFVDPVVRTGADDTAH